MMNNLYDNSLSKEELSKKFALLTGIERGENYIKFGESIFEKNLKKAALETGDEASLIAYAKIFAAKEYKKHDNYARIFGLCKKLNVNNLYDIGCGEGLQVFLIMSYLNMTYTGIDCEDNISYFDYQFNNKIFAEHCEERIKFKKGYYPYMSLTPIENNIAISLFCLTMCKEQQIKDAAIALSRDFDRVLMNVHNKDFEAWEVELSAFKLYKIGNNGLFFGTKFSNEIDMLNEIDIWEEKKYDFYDNRFMIDIALPDGTLTLSSLI